MIPTERAIRDLETSGGYCDGVHLIVSVGGGMTSGYANQPQKSDAINNLPSTRLLWKPSVVPEPGIQKASVHWKIAQLQKSAALQNVWMLGWMRNLPIMHSTMLVREAIMPQTMPGNSPRPSRAISSSCNAIPGHSGPRKAMLCYASTALGQPRCHNMPFCDHSKP